MSHQRKKTKIVATLGPATGSKTIIKTNDGRRC